jgi:creatinine amidohydrolase
MSNNQSQEIPMRDVPVCLWEMTRREFREGVDDGRIVGAIVPTGSTEQHNEHLEMVHDTASAIHVSRRVAENLRLQVVVTTPLAIGVSEHWMNHKGTLTTRPDIFVELLHDVCDSMVRAGISRILIVNGHAGNTRPVRDRLEELRGRLGVDLDFCSYWEAYTEADVARNMESGVCPGHASEFETSFAEAAFPSHVHWEGVDYDGATLHFPSAEQAEQDRKFHGEAKLANGDKGRAMIDIAVNWVTEKMQGMIG